jgi:catalase
VARLVLSDVSMSFNFNRSKLAFALAGSTMVSATAGVASAAPATDTPSTSGAQTSSPSQLVDALHSAFGKHPARAVHAKGIILDGDFTPDRSAASLTTAAHLQKAHSAITVRFSDFTGIPDIADNIGLANPRGFAIKFRLPDGATTDIVGHSFNGFPTPTSDQFRELLLAIAASGPDAAKPTALDKFLQTHPIAKTFLTTQKTPASFGTIAYFGVNAFELTNRTGVRHYVRYQFLPAAGEHLFTADELAKAGPNYLMDEIRARVAKGPIKYQMYAQLAEQGDVIADPSVAWPDSRKKVLLGTIDIKRLGSNTPEQDKTLAFSPNNVPTGIKTADPMLDFRSRAYPISVKERQ